MLKMLLACAAAFALAASSPALACPDCKNCPSHKDKVAAAEKKDQADKTAECPCGKAGEACKCAAGCTCPHCAAKKAEKKNEKKI